VYAITGAVMLDLTFEVLVRPEITAIEVPHSFGAFGALHFVRCRLLDRDLILVPDPKHEVRRSAAAAGMRVVSMVHPPLSMLPDETRVQILDDEPRVALEVLRQLPLCSAHGDEKPLTEKAGAAQGR
jgi:hypothetical protein